MEVLTLLRFSLPPPSQRPEVLQFLGAVCVALATRLAAIVVIIRLARQVTRSVRSSIPRASRRVAIWVTPSFVKLSQRCCKNCSREYRIQQLRKKTIALRQSQSTCISLQSVWINRAYSLRTKMAKSSIPSSYQPSSLITQEKPHKRWVAWGGKMMASILYVPKVTLTVTRMPLLVETPSLWCSRLAKIRTRRLK